MYLDLWGSDRGKYYCSVKVGPGNCFDEKFYRLTEPSYNLKISIQAPKDETVTALVTFYEACNACTPYYTSGRTKLTASVSIRSGQTRYADLEAAFGDLFTQCQ